LNGSLNGRAGAGSAAPTRAAKVWSWATEPGAGGALVCSAACIFKT
jgi:hypothetical protein